MNIHLYVVHEVEGRSEEALVAKLSLASLDI